MQMVEEIKKLSARFKDKGWPEIRIGVGVNSGSMNVGNMGSEFRMAYTVMGDTVNLGSRLEGLTKNYGVDIIVSEYTKAAVDDFEYRVLDRVRVKGKDLPVTIYEPLGLKSELSQQIIDELSQYDLAMQEFLQQHWTDAEQKLKALAKQHPDRKLYTLYLERIEVYKNNPPPENWDGVFTHLSK
jgi:adenylate cyclase